MKVKGTIINFRGIVRRYIRYGFPAANSAGDNWPLTVYIAFSPSLVADKYFSRLWAFRKYLIDPITGRSTLT